MMHGFLFVAGWLHATVSAMLDAVATLHVTKVGGENYGSMYMYVLMVCKSDAIVSYIKD